MTIQRGCAAHVPCHPALAADLHNLVFVVLVVFHFDDTTSLLIHNFVVTYVGHGAGVVGAGGGSGEFHGVAPSRARAVGGVGNHKVVGLFRKLGEDNVEFAGEGCGSIMSLRLIESAPAESAFRYRRTAVRHHIAFQGSARVHQTGRSEGGHHRDGVMGGERQGVAVGGGHAVDGVRAHIVGGAAGETRDINGVCTGASCLPELSDS